MRKFHVSRQRNLMFMLNVILSSQMHKIGLRPSGFTYDGFIKCVIAGKGVAHAIKVVC